MTYLIQGLPPRNFAHLFAMSDPELTSHRAVRVTAGEGGGMPCRISLVEAEAGEKLLLVNHVSNRVDTPYRSAFAIYVREAATEAARFVDEVPALLDRRHLGLRGLDSEGRLLTAALAAPGEADARIRKMLGSADIVAIRAHNAAFGCFLARVERA